MRLTTEAFLRIAWMLSFYELEPAWSILVGSLIFSGGIGGVESGLRVVSLAVVGSGITA